MKLSSRILNSKVLISFVFFLSSLFFYNLLYNSKEIQTKGKLVNVKVIERDKIDLPSVNSYFKFEYNKKIYCMRIEGGGNFEKIVPNENYELIYLKSKDDFRFPNVNYKIDLILVYIIIGTGLYFLINGIFFNPPLMGKKKRVKK